MDRDGVVLKMEIGPGGVAAMDLVPYFGTPSIGLIIDTFIGRFQVSEIARRHRATLGAQVIANFLDEPGATGTPN